MIFSSIDEWAFNLGWVDIDRIPPVGAVTTHTCGSWYLLGRGRQSLRHFFCLFFSWNLVSNLHFKLGITLRKLRNGQAGPSPVVALCTK